MCKIISSISTIYSKKKDTYIVLRSNRWQNIQLSYRAANCTKCPLWAKSKSKHVATIFIKTHLKMIQNHFFASNLWRDKIR